MTKKKTAEAVIAAAARAEARAAGQTAADQQLELLPPTRFHPVDDERKYREMVEAVTAHRKGRPPGAQNRVNRDMLDFIRKTIGDPLLESARWLMHTPESLAAELGCDRAEAFDRLERIRQDLRPYFYAKQAPVDGTGKPVPGLTVQITAHGGPQTSQLGADAPPWLYLQSEPAPDAATEQNQRLINVSPGVSHGEPRDQS